MCALMGLIAQKELRVTARRLSCFLDSYIGMAPVVIPIVLLA
jgi:hypothetical protein